ncbi:8-oxo-dGTP pyrophosphatase MutT, NUDIX family [Geosmithia morbida]|uniref:8-oxo-dGTP pyrophosphatase MutT, NUDIX family n=1 Tax=Geosmithia morbida TaxID=1094350 RepID=A0A9P4YQ64_9HYPO|nr:8-oxo-dGTP pyrophosphatase MutT, NUDIX family [Geosmithia morbida]KAF4119782.1 8-oxo-dGTP pyrophosphatase MutT, NUDIX family [Geosmithia morbida]
MAFQPKFPFSRSEDLSGWDVPRTRWLDSQAAQGTMLNGLMTSAIVFDTDQERRRILLLKRAAHDSMPNRWEPPGGGVDAEDASILNACARELYEEAGLVATRVVREVVEGRRTFKNRTGERVFVAVVFEVEVCNDDEMGEDDQRSSGDGISGRTGERGEDSQRSEDGIPVRTGERSEKTEVELRVKLDHNEHSAWRWATEEEVRREKMMGQDKDGKTVILGDMPITDRHVRDMLLGEFAKKRSQIA